MSLIFEKRGKILGAVLSGTAIAIQKGTIMWKRLIRNSVKPGKVGKAKWGKFAQLAKFNAKMRSFLSGFERFLDVLPWYSEIILMFFAILKKGRFLITKFTQIDKMVARFTKSTQKGLSA